MEPADTSAVLQPVLQWGVSAAGGGNYWAIASWYLLLPFFSLSPSSPSPLTFSFLVLPSFSDFLFILCRLVSSIHPTIVSPLLTVESGDVIEGTFSHLLFPSLFLPFILVRLPRFSSSLLLSSHPTSFHLQVSTSIHRMERGLSPLLCKTRRT